MMGKRKVILGIFVALFALGLPSLVQHVRWFISGHVEAMVVQQRWDLVLINITIFLAFLVPLNIRKKINWKSMSIYTAFIVSLFVEMYGIPLTIYISSSTVFSSFGAPPSQEVLFTLNFLGISLAMTFWKIIGALITIGGLLIIIIGWLTLYNNLEENKIVKSGIYRYSRHPQYLGILLISFGWFLHWPSLVTIIMLPILIYFYYNLTKTEEKELIEELDDPEEYQRYREKTPLFI